MFRTISESDVWAKRSNKTARDKIIGAFHPNGKKNSTRVSHVHGLTHKIILLRTNVYCVCIMHIYNCKVVYALHIIVRLVRSQNAV